MKMEKEMKVKRKWNGEEGSRKIERVAEEVGRKVTFLFSSLINESNKSNYRFLFCNHQSTQSIRIARRHIIQTQHVGDRQS